MLPRNSRNIRRLRIRIEVPVGLAGPQLFFYFQQCYKFSRLFLEESLKSLPGKVFLFAIFLSTLAAQDSAKPRQIPLATGKVLNTPSPGRIGAVNSFPATIALSPDGHYGALLNDGYGTQQTQVHQSITILDLATNQLSDFPDARLSD